MQIKKLQSIMMRRSRLVKLIFVSIFVLALFFQLAQYLKQAIGTDASAKPIVLERPVLQQHHYRTDGLLVVNPNGPHPVFELMDRAAMDWKSKLTRASKSLNEAVAEYKRRYGRAPPRFFDDWWRYVEKHNVQLPDEYDQIWRDLEPYWGFNPVDLLAIESDLETKVDCFTLGKTGSGPVSIVNMSLREGQSHPPPSAYDFLDLLGPIEHLLPPFRAVFSPNDSPNRLTDYDIKALALKAAATNTYLDIDNLPPVEYRGWVSACAPSSPARSKPINLDCPPPPPSKKTFIFDHRLSMDPCLHPNLLYNHGQFVSHEMGPGAQRGMIPEISLCATLLHHDVLPATPINWIDDILPRNIDPPWDEKPDERLLWRGSNSGIHHGPETRWRVAQRARLVTLTNQVNGTVKVLKSPKSRDERVGKAEDVRRARINPAVMDIAFTGDPGCADTTCDELQDLFEWRRKQNAKDAGQYKYVVDVDGNGWSSRFKRLITSNSLIFKSTIYPEWYSDRVAPWVHFVPVQVDFSDLYDALTFFRGDMNGEGAHEDLARKIAIAGRKWSRTFWRKEDMTAYMFRLILEYARLMSPDRESMTFGYS